MKIPSSSKKSYNGLNSRTEESSRRSTSSNSRDKMKHSERKQLFPERQHSSDSHTHEKPFSSPNSTESFRKAVEERFCIHHHKGTSPENDYPVTLNHSRDSIEDVHPIIQITSDDIENQQSNGENPDFSYSFPPFPSFPPMIPGYPVPMVPSPYPMNISPYNSYAHNPRTIYNMLEPPPPCYGYIPQYFRPGTLPQSSSPQPAFASQSSYPTVTSSYPTAQNNNISVTNYNYPPAVTAPTTQYYPSSAIPFYPISPPRYGYSVPSAISEEQTTIPPISPQPTKQEVLDLQATLHPSYTPAVNPGPTIKLGEMLKGPKGCNLFVFHLPNETTNW
jgi:hypothetical protein